MALKISKTQFVDAVYEIQLGLNKRNEFNDAMEKYSSSFFTTTIGEEWLNTLLALLSSCVGDTDIKGVGTTLEWFLFESAPKIITITEHNADGTENTVAFDVSTPEKLYEYFERYGELS